MIRKELIQSISITRHDEKDGISFTAYCPYGCSHTDFSVVHYGKEQEAELSVIGKMINHCKRCHGVELTDDLA